MVQVHGSKPYPAQKLASHEVFRAVALDDRLTARHAGDKANLILLVAKPDKQVFEVRQTRPVEGKPAGREILAADLMEMVPCRKDRAVVRGNPLYLWVLMPLGARTVRPLLRLTAIERRKILMHASSQHSCRHLFGIVS